MQPTVRIVCEIDQGLIDTYPLDDLPWKPNPYGICGMIESPPMMEEFFNLVTKDLFQGYKLGLNMVSKIIKGQTIQLHTDRHDRGCRDRIHIPLKTNPHAWFYDGDGFSHMPLGQAYLMDPSAAHGVVNFGKEDRIHLIFNVVGVS